MAVFAVLYDYAENSEEPRNVHRSAHREFLGTLTGEVKALATGPFAAAPAGALLVVEAGSAPAVEQELDQDPFYRNGLVSRRQVREWTQVRGPWAS